MNSKEQQQLADALCRQEPAAQRRLLQVYGDMAYSMILKLVGNELDAEEVYQDVFLKVFRHAKDYDPSLATLDVWLRRIAYNESLNRMRHRNVRLTYTNDDRLIEMSDLMASDTGEEADMTLIAQALDRLEHSERTLIEMYYYDNLTIKDIAYVARALPSTIGSRLCRIRKKLYSIIRELNRQKQK